MKIHLRKRVLSLLLGTTLTLCHGSFSCAEIIDQGDYVKAPKTVNIRYNNDINSLQLGMIDKSQEAYRLFSCNDNWDLVRLGDTIGYVCRDYIEVSNNIKDDIIYQEFLEPIYPTCTVNFRLGPSLEEESIGSIKQGEELETIAITNNNWYVVKYDNKIGFVCGNFVTTLEQLIKEQCNIDITNLKVIKMAYTNHTLNVRDSMSLDGNIVYVLDKYESIKVLEETDEWYLILKDNIVGYVLKEYTNSFENVYIIIDLSSQKMYLYNNLDVVVKTNVTTGKNSNPTRIGLFKIYSKETNRYLVGEDYKSYVNYWLPFDGGIGIHDASWRDNFGGTIYQNNGSHGCVNTPYEAVKDIYDQVEVGTKVLVQK